MIKTHLKAAVMKIILSLLLLAFLTFPAEARQANPASQPMDGRACLILALYHEARGESAESIAKHAWTVVWRVKRDEFPNNLCAVIFQRGNFSAFNRGIRPMRDQRDKARVTKIADIVLKKAFPSTFGGDECLEFHIKTDICSVTVADTLAKPADVTTHYAVSDCQYLRKPGYNYVRTEEGRCVPRWSLKMTMVSAEPCAKVRRRACDVVFWKAN
ncbi:MAG: cell wall hydrolase [Alphaproteobacteria bacterium]